MINRLSKLLAEGKSLSSEAEVRQAVIALSRIILQHAVIAVAEWLIEIRKQKPQQFIDSAPLNLNQLRKPSDGTLISSLAELLVAAENAGWLGISRPFWETIKNKRPCCNLTDTDFPSVESLLKCLVTIRNNGVEGHGLPGGYKPEGELDLIELITEKFSHFLPAISEENDELIIETPETGKYTLKTLRTYSGDLICYREIKRTSSGKCIVKAQRQKTLFSKEDVCFEATDILGWSTEELYPTYEIVSTYDEEWSPLCILPDRLTEQFTGRKDKLSDLADWANDLESRACLLYGDGGIGKTTLTIEFIHRILDGTLKINWRPELITFYTAKKTRWGLNSPLKNLKFRQTPAATDSRMKSPSIPKKTSA